MAQDPYRVSRQRPIPREPTLLPANSPHAHTNTKASLQSLCAIHGCSHLQPLLEKTACPASVLILWKTGSSRFQVNVDTVLDAFNFLMNVWHQI